VNGAANKDQPPKSFFLICVHAFYKIRKPSEQ